MNLLFFGDIVGKPGRRAIKETLPRLKRKFKLDFILANAENLAHGISITEKSVKEVLDAGIDVLTSGNHIYQKKEAIKILEEGKLPVLRPANYPPGVAGKGYDFFQVKKKKILVFNLIGRVFFQEDFDCPFRCADSILAKTKKENPDIIIVDAHTEATSEARALGFYLDGRVSACLGTHTHVPTSDEQILPRGTAYVSDIGMVGTKNSVLGCKKERVIEHFLTQMPFKDEIEEKGEFQIDAICLEINDKTNRVEKITRV